MTNEKTLKIILNILRRIEKREVKEDRFMKMFDDGELFNTIYQENIEKMHRLTEINKTLHGRTAEQMIKSEEEALNKIKIMGSDLKKLEKIKKMVE